MKKSPCIGCDVRKPGCHDNCPLFYNWKLERNKISENAHEYSQLYYGQMLGYNKMTKRRLKK